MFAFSSDFGGPFAFIFSTLSAIVLIAAWVILAGSRFVQGGVMERPERVPQLYGYTACLIAPFWALTAILGLVEYGLTLAEPAYQRDNEYGLEPAVTSFEAFRITYDRARRFNTPDSRDAQLDSVPEAELRRRYETYRADRVRLAQVRARQDLVTHSVSLAIAAALFAFHWRWVRRRETAPAT